MKLLTPGLMKRRRLARGYSQRELAERAGCSQSLIAMIERGYTPSDKKLAAISAVLYEPITRDQKRRVHLRRKRREYRERAAKRKALEGDPTLIP